MQSPGAPVRPGLGRGQEACSGCGVGSLEPSAWFLSALARWGWPCPCSFWPVCLATDLSTLTQVCGGTPEDAALREPKAALPEA